MPPAPVTSSPIDHDLPCLKCRYNLRTLSPDALCPECATPVQQSLAYHQHYAGLDFRRLTTATSLLAIIPGLSLLLLVAGRSHPIFGGHVGTGVILPLIVLTAYFLVYAVLFHVTVILLAPTRSRRLAPTLAHGICFVYPLLVLAVGLLGVLLILCQQDILTLNFLGGFDRLMALFDRVFAIECAYRALLCVLAFLYLRHLARRLRRPWLTPLAAIALLLLASVCLLFALLLFLDAAQPLTERGPIIQQLHQIAQLSIYPQIALQTLLWTLLTLTLHRAAFRPVPATASTEVLPPSQAEGLPLK